MLPLEDVDDITEVKDANNYFMLKNKVDVSEDFGFRCTENLLYKAFDSLRVII